MSWFRNLAETSVLQPALQPSLLPQPTDTVRFGSAVSFGGGFSSPCSISYSSGSSFGSPFGR